MRLPTALTAALLLMSQIGGGAHAAWSGSGTGAGHGSASTLPAPSSVTTSCTATQDVAVTWSSSEASPVVTAFAIQRTADGGASWGDVTTVPASTASNYSYEDLNLTAGSYAYRVVATTGGWSAVSATSATRVIAEAKGKKPRAFTCS